LIPAVIIWIITLSIGIGTDNLGFAVPFFLLSVYIVLALLTGISLRITTNIKASRMFKASQRYAELHGWLPISRTQWRNRKRNTILLSVTKALTKNTYILTIEIEGESIVVDEFETSTWALQFGDWLWEQLLTDSPQVTREVVVEKRAEWEQTTALAVRR
jgi:hypothetical protein